MVRVLPPRESFRSLVSFESQYGTKVPFLDLSERMLMQFPRASKDLLMFAPSTILWPVLCETAARSEPAKSIKLSLEFVTESKIPFLSFRASTPICKMAWDRDEN